MGKKTTRITIETERTLIVRQGSLGRAWCENCACETEMISLDALGRLVGGEPQKIQQWIDSGALHSATPEHGSVRICLNSLLRLFNEGTGPETASRLKRVSGEVVTDSQRF